MTINLSDFLLAQLFIALIVLVIVLIVFVIKSISLISKVDKTIDDIIMINFFLLILMLKFLFAMQKY